MERPKRITKKLGIAVSQHRQFTVQLESFGNEAKIAACYVYGEMAVKHAASKSGRLLNRLNRTPTFWLVSAAAFQTAGYISFGRIFDRKSRYNVHALLDAAEREITLDCTREAMNCHGQILSDLGRSSTYS